MPFSEKFIFTSSPLILLNAKYLGPVISYSVTVHFISLWKLSLLSSSKKSLDKSNSFGNGLLSISSIGHLIAKQRSGKESFL